jgi:hypothetical protein
MPENLQDRYASNGVCFGCGPNSHRLNMKGVPSRDGVVANRKPKPHHVAFGNFGSGGIISVLMDFQGNWAAARALMRSKGLSPPPGTLTSEYCVKFLRSSPIDGQWRLGARATAIDGVVTATMTGTFVASRDSYPAFYRWH